IARGCDLLLGEAAEVTQLDDLGLAGVQLRKSLERVVEGDHVPRALGRCDRLVDIDRWRAGPSPLAPLLARVVHQDLPHVARGDGKEMGTVREVQRDATYELQIHL